MKKAGQAALVFVMILAAALCAGACMRAPSLPVAAAAVPVPAETAAPTPRAPAPDTPSPKPSLLPPTPAPSPTPPPDPWAAHFSPEGPYLMIRDADRGPWIYRDKTFAIEISIPQKGIDATHYYRADIYTRGPLPCCGFADNNIKGTNLQLPYKFAREQKAVLAINGQYVRASYNPKGVILYGGNVFWDSNKAPTMAFLPSGEMKVYEPGEIHAQGLLALGVKDAFSFGPILVKDGKIHPSVQRSRLNYHSWRTAIGQAEPGHFIIIVTKNGITLTELAKLFIQCGCPTAYNLDGGHSAALVFMGNQLNKSGGKQAMQRPVPDMMMIGFSSAVPGVNDPVYANGFSLNRKYRPQPTDGLIQTGDN